MFGSFLGIPSSTAVAQLSTCSLYMRSAPALPGFCRYGLIAFRHVLTRIANPLPHRSQPNFLAALLLRDFAKY